MVKVSYDQKPYRKFMMNTWGAKVFSSPTNMTESGTKILAEDSNYREALALQFLKLLKELLLQAIPNILSAAY